MKLINNKKFKIILLAGLVSCLLCFILVLRSNVNVQNVLISAGQYLKGRKLDVDYWHRYFGGISFLLFSFVLIFLFTMTCIFLIDRKAFFSFVVDKERTSKDEDWMKSDFLKLSSKRITDNWGYVVLFAFLIVALLYTIVYKGNIYIQVHDNLDSNIAHFKVLRDQGLFWKNNINVPILGGIDRNYFISDLKVYSLLYLIFPTFEAMIIGWFLKIMISVTGFVLLGWELYGRDKESNYFVVCGMLYGIMPTFPVAAFGFASLPLLLVLLIKLYKSCRWEYFALLFIYPLLSDFACFGVFICAYILIFFVIDWIVEKRPAIRFIVALFSVALGIVLTEWRLFYMILFLKEESIRTSFAQVFLGFWDAMKTFINAFVFGQYHSASSHGQIILPVCVVFFLYITYSYISKGENKKIIADPFIWVMLLQIFNCLIYVFDQMKWFKTFMGILLPLLDGFNYRRTLWFSPFLWCLGFMMVLCRLPWKSIFKAVLCFAAILSVCLSPNVYNHIYYNSAMTVVNSIGKEKYSDLLGYPPDMLSYNEFYSTELFDRIKRDIGYNGEWSISYGMHPSIAEYNDIASLDGYLSIYPLNYKVKFRKMISPELEIDKENAQYFDTWGGRAYVFSEDISYRPNRQMTTNEADMLIDPTAFRDMGGKYVFSRVRIKNNADLGLTQIGKYEDEKSPYTIYVYSTIGDN